MTHHMTHRRHVARTVMLVVLTPLLEKNVFKTMSVDVPLVFSMRRLIVLAFAAGMLRQIWYAGIAGWPDATLAIAIVLALPILGALERAKPEQVLDVAKTLLGRASVGGARRTGDVYDTEPSKFDDHRND
ncbi:MAG: hypothetical protein ABI442_07545 [Gemmatimonadaceae bacterium]